MNVNQVSAYSFSNIFTGISIQKHYRQSREKEKGFLCMKILDEHFKIQVILIMRDNEGIHGEVASLGLKKSSIYDEFVCIFLKIDLKNSTATVRITK